MTSARGLTSSRQYDLFSLLFGPDEAENATAPHEDPQAPYTKSTVPGKVESTTAGTEVQSSSEKGFLDALRDGLNYIDKNGNHFEKILNGTNTTVVAEGNKTTDEEEFSLFDLLLGGEEIFSSPSAGDNLGPTTDISRPYITNSPMMIKPVLPEGVRNESIKFALLPMSLYNMVTDDGNILFGSGKNSTGTTVASVNEGNKNYESTTKSTKLHTKASTEAPPTESTTYSEQETTTNLAKESTTDGDEESTIVDGTTDESLTTEGNEYPDYTAEKGDNESTDYDFTEATTTASKYLNDDYFTTDSQDLSKISTDQPTSATSYDFTTEPAMTDYTTEFSRDVTRKVSQIEIKTNSIDENWRTDISTEIPTLATKLNIKSTAQHIVTTYPTTEKMTISTHATASTANPKESLNHVMENKESFENLNEVNTESAFSAFLDGFSSIFTQANMTKISDKLDITNGTVFTKMVTTTEKNRKSTPIFHRTTTTESEEIPTIRPTERPSQMVKVNLTPVSNTVKPMNKDNSTKWVYRTSPAPSPAAIHTTQKSPVISHSSTKGEKKTTTRSTEKPIIINSNPSILDVDINYDYDEPTLPPSLPNLKIIPFLPTDAVKNVIKSDRHKNKYDYYQTVPVLTVDNKAPIQDTKYPVYSVDAVDDRIDYDVYKPENKDGTSYNSFGDVVNVNSKIDFEMFDHTAFPPIIKDPLSPDKNSVDKYPYGNNYDYDSYNLPSVVKPQPNLDFKNYIPNQFNAGQVYNADDSYRVPDFEKFATVYPEKHAIYGEAEHKTDNHRNVNQFSPPSKTEGRTKYFINFANNQ